MTEISFVSFCVVKKKKKRLINKSIKDVVYMVYRQLAISQAHTSLATFGKLDLAD